MVLHRERGVWKNMEKRYVVFWTTPYRYVQFPALLVLKKVFKSLILLVDSGFAEYMYKLIFSHIHPLPYATPIC